MIIKIKLEIEKISSNEIKLKNFYLIKKEKGHLIKGFNQTI